MKVYNTLSRQKEEFIPGGEEVTMYVCGINPYADAHIGHAMSYIFFDVVRRYLEFRGYKVKHVQNITDIEDNIITHANELGISVPELTQKYVERYDEDMAALNVLPAHVYPRAMGEIDKMIEIVSGLVEKGFAYVIGGNVYFRVRNVPDYGKLSGRSLDSMMAGARIEAGEEKEHPMDFILWKEAKPGEPSWESPWGMGRPGWHIECSAMSLKYLGETIDIHGGGQDVLFPHHENEIAQSESFTGKKPFVKYWLHNGLLKMHETDEAKMSRSLGNLVTIREALKMYSADAIRIFILSSYYRSPLTYSEETLEADEKGAERLRQAASRKITGEKTAENIDFKSYESKFIEAMDDDFNTARSIAVLFDLASEINRFGDEGYDVINGQQVLIEVASVLGLRLELLEELSLETKIRNEVNELYNQGNLNDIPNIIKSNLPRLDESKLIRTSLRDSLDEKLENARSSQNFITFAKETELYEESLNSLRDELRNSVSLDYDRIFSNLNRLDATAHAGTVACIEIRKQLRKARQFQLADEIRSKLDELGIALEDTPDGTVWKMKRYSGR